MGISHVILPGSVESQDFRSKKGVFPAALQGHLMILIFATNVTTEPDICRLFEIRIWVSP